MLTLHNKKRDVNWPGHVLYRRIIRINRFRSSRSKHERWWKYSMYYRIIATLVREKSLEGETISSWAAMVCNSHSSRLAVSRKIP